MSSTFDLRGWLCIRLHQDSAFVCVFAFPLRFYKYLTSLQQSALNISHQKSGGSNANDCNVDNSKFLHCYDNDCSGCRVLYNHIYFLHKIITSLA